MDTEEFVNIGQIIYNNVTYDLSNYKINNDKIIMNKKNHIIKTEPNDLIIKLYDINNKQHRFNINSIYEQAFNIISEPINAKEDFEEEWLVYDKSDIEYRNIKIEISNFGNVRYIENKKIVPQVIGTDGYPNISIRVKNEKHAWHPRVHRLVAELFCENDDIVNKIQVDHIDSNKINNKFNNLRWVTKSENQMNKKPSILEKNKIEDDEEFRSIGIITLNDDISYDLSDYKINKNKVIINKHKCVMSVSIDKRITFNITVDKKRIRIHLYVDRIYLQVFEDLPYNSTKDINKATYKNKAVNIVTNETLIFSSLKEAADHFNVPYKKISDHVKENSIWNGYIWSFINE